jgi:hypothetical protein
VAGDQSEAGRLMIRAATPADLPRLRELVEEMHERSEFKARGIELSSRLVQSFLFDGLRKHGGQHAGSTLLNVVDFRGQVEGFMLALLQPVYAVCTKLEAVDFWLFATKRAPKLAPARLIDEYLTWAQSCPKVVDIILSWTDVVGVDGAKLARLYQRKGFRRRGEIFVRAGQ